MLSAPLDGSNETSTAVLQHMPAPSHPLFPTATGVDTSLTPCFQYLLSEMHMMLNYKGPYIIKKKYYLVINQGRGTSMAYSSLKTTN